MPGDSLTTYSLSDVAKHNTPESTWIVLDNKVYDVTKFLVEHPGGEEVIVSLAGQDCTDEFNDVGHSADARAMTQDYLVGQLQSDDQVDPVKQSESADGSSWTSILTSSTWSNFYIPLSISLIVYTLFKISQKTLLA